MKKVSIGQLELKKPIIQGGMGVGVSLSNLAGAVAAEGGMGIISSAQIGFREPDFYENPFEANCRAIHSEFDKARSLAPEGIIGFNIMYALSHYGEYVTEAVKAGADVIISGAGLPIELPEYVKASSVKIAPVVSSGKAASVILKMWDRRYGRCADFLVIEGPKAGGHLGFCQDDLMESEQMETENGDSNEMLFAILKDVLEIVKGYEEKYERKIPVFVAGGIHTEEMLHMFLEQGAAGIQIATPFVTTEECDAAKAYKEAYIKAEKEDICIVKSPVGMPGRAIKNQFMKQVECGMKFPPEKCLGCLKHCKPAEIPYCITERLIAAAKGDVEEALLFCGADAYQETRIKTVKEVFEIFD